MDVFQLCRLVVRLVIDKSEPETFNQIQEKVPYYSKRIFLRYSLIASISIVPSFVIATDTEVGLDLSLVENFDQPHRESPTGDNYYGAFADSKSLGSCYVFFYGGVDKVLHGEGYSMHLQWDVSKEGAFGGYWNRLQHINLENYNYLTFYVRGFSGGEVFKVGLRGTENAAYETKIPIAELLKSNVTTEWQRVIIPLQLFTAIENWGDVSIFSINVEHAFNSGEGQILIDDIAFQK